MPPLWALKKMLRAALTRAFLGGNPLRHALCRLSEVWPMSGVRCVLGRRRIFERPGAVGRRQRGWVWRLGGVGIGALLTGAVLAGCEPQPVQVAEFPNAQVSTAVSGNGRFIVVGSQNVDLNTSGGSASLSVEDRDVNGDGKLDEQGNTSYNTYFGAGSSGTRPATNISTIDSSSLFVPAISPDGSTIAFEAHLPSGPDCVYTVPVASIATATPTQVACTNVSLAADYMEPSVSNNGSFIAYP